MNYELVYIAGEGVSFVPTGLASNETVIVDFEKYYRPDGISDIQFEHLQSTMRKLFDGRLKKTQEGEDEKSLQNTMKSILEESVSTPLPPCSPDEKKLVLQSLLHRKSVLLQQLYDLGVYGVDEMKHKLEHLDELNTKETLLVRTHLLHLVALNKLITSYKETQECINLEDIVYGSKPRDFDEDTLRELLKQFVFFLLQSSHPLKDYTKTNVKAPEFVERLEKNPIGKKFDPFLETYKSNKFSIPPMIAKVLEATDLDSKAMSEEVKRQVVLEKEAILNKIKDLIPPTDPFWKSIITLTDPVSIVKQLHTQAIQSIDTIKFLEVENSGLETSIKTCKQAKKALQAEKARIEKKVTDLEQELQSKEGNENNLTQLRNQMTSLQEEYEQRIAALTEQGRVYLEEKQRYEARILEFTTANTQLLSEIDGLKERVRQLEEIEKDAETNIEELKQRHAKELQAEKDKVAEKESALVAAQQVIDTTRQESDAKINELAISKLALEEAKRTTIAKDAAIAGLRKSLEQQETREEALRNELAAKSEDEVRLQTDITNAQASIDELNDELGELRDRLGEAEGATQEIEQLQASLLEKENELEDLQTQLDQCNNEKERLRGEVSAPAQEVARLGAELDTAKEERDEALNKQQELTSTIESLRAELAQEKSSKEEVESSKKVLEGELDSYKQDSEKSKEKSRELEAELLRTKKDLEQQFGEELAKAKEGLESELAKGMDDMAKQALEGKKRLQEEADAKTQTLEKKLQEEAEEKKRLQEEADAKIKTLEKKVEGLDITLEWYEEHAQIDENERKQLQKSLEFVRQIASAIDSGSAIPTIPTNAPQEESSALTTILQALTKKMEAQTQTQGQTQTGSADICYLIFFASFLWRTHFPTPLKLDQQTISSYYTTMGMTQKIQMFFTYVFSNELNGKSGIYMRVGLEKINAKNPSPSQIMRKYLVLLNKLAQAMVSSKDGSIIGMTDTEVQYTTLLITRVKEVITYSNMTDSSFLRSVTDELLTKQPSINPALLTNYIVIVPEKSTSIQAGTGKPITLTKDVVKIVRKTETTTETQNPSVVNYPILFYSFLMVTRDYLNTIKTDSLLQCPLPAVLKK